MNEAQSDRDRAENPRSQRSRGLTRRSPQAWQRLVIAGIAAFVLFTLAQAPVRAETGDDMHAFVAALWPQAARHGVSRATFNAALAGLRSDPVVLAHIHNQAEFVKPIGDYLASAVSEEHIGRGRSAAGQLQRTLARIEAIYGVDRYTLLAVWGIESNFGGFTGRTNVVRALATLADAGYHGTYFKGELIDALRILQEGHVGVPGMTGSWAGAMGQTQFMPSSFLKYAVDFSGDGHKNIWTNIPDALASTANYLARHGWIRDFTWGYEVLLPRGFDPRRESSRRHTFAAFAAAGVRRADGARMPTEGRADLVMPAGADGPAFLVTKNFSVIKSYNASTAYALAVGLLSDRIAGSPPLRTPWPAGQRASLQ